MSKEKKQNVKGEEDGTLDGNDDEQIDNLEAANGTSDSTSSDRIRESSDLSSDTNRDLLQYVAEGIEVQTSDVLIIEELPEDSCCGRNSHERLDTTIFYEFPTDFDDENCNHLPQAYFDNTDNIHSHGKADISDLSEINSLLQIQEKQTVKPLKVSDKKKRDKTISESIRKTEGTSKAISDTEDKKKVKELKEKKAPILEMQYNRCEVLKSPHIPIFEFMCIKPKNKCDTLQFDDGKHTFKCTDYGSDEFADIEDNARDSSSDNNESTTKTKATLLKGLFLEGKSKEERKAEIPGGSKALKVIPVACSSSSENNVSSDTLEDKSIPSTSKKNCESSCSYFSQNNSKRMKTIPATKTSDEAKKKYTVGMSTIAEVPELEDDANISETSQPSHSKPNPLKMKTRVVNRKDKCNVCNVRLGLCAIRCRCGGYYCAKHRYDKEHDCTFDYRTMGAEEIRRNNPKVVAEKVRKL